MVPSLENLEQYALVLCALRSLMTLSELKSHNLTQPSDDVVETVLPSLWIAHPQSPNVWALNVAMDVPLSESHILAVLSCDAETNLVLSVGLQQTKSTELICSLSVAIG